MNESKPIFFDTSDGQQLRVNMIGSWLRRRFGRKVVKCSLDGGFTCPNRDGSKGWGGCLFCSDSGSGDMASAVCETCIAAALQEQRDLLSRKWPDAGCIAYFQSHTNTYAPVSVLRRTFEAALQQPGVLGLAIATRPDCISDEVLDLLAELNERTFLWVELGLQTIHDATADAMNLCHVLADYDDAIRRLSEADIRTVTHLILGLPGETQDMMLDSVRYVCRPLPRKAAADTASPCVCGVPGSSFASPLPVVTPGSARLFGLKLHMLNVVRGSGMAQVYPDYIPFSSIDEYTDLVVQALELVPPDITIHRIGGDAPRSILIAPSWSYRKRTILNEVHRKLREQNTWQGRLAAKTDKREII